MTKRPRILVTSAAGHTGRPVVEALLAKGYPVRAFVRKKDRRSATLAKQGAEIFAGDLFDFRDLRKALEGVTRAYHCPPFAPNALHGSMMFCLAAEEARLEAVALLTAFNPHSAHPSVFTREMWLTQNVARWMPTVGVIHINPGLFAFPYFFGIPAIMHLGMLMLPFGDGGNAPPSNEDIAAVAAAVLAEPESHLGRRYRPTGPKLLTPQDCAVIMGQVLGRKVRYQDISTKMFTKAATAMRLSRWEIAQIRHYAEELRSGAYAVGAPTDHVERVCGRPAESFAVTAERMFQHPEWVAPWMGQGSRWSALAMLVRTMFTRVPDLDVWEDRRGRPRLQKPLLAHENEEWLVTARQKDLNLVGLAPS